MVSCFFFFFHQLGFVFMIICFSLVYFVSVEWQTQTTQNWINYMKSINIKVCIFEPFFFHQLGFMFIWWTSIYAYYWCSDVGWMKYEYHFKRLYSQFIVFIDSNLHLFLLKGLEILAFPCNQFGEEEPGSNVQIAEFVCTQFRSEFPIFDKVLDWETQNHAALTVLLKLEKNLSILTTTTGYCIQWIHRHGW